MIEANQHLDPRVLLKIDRICRRFERDWINQKASPGLSSYLDQIADSHRPFLVSHLIVIDWERRLAAGEQPERNEYIRQFPLLADAIAELDTDAIDAEYQAERQVDAAARPASEMGDFELIRPIGRGGMGEVFEARQRSLDRVVALKLLPPGFRGSIHVSRFQREARAIGRLHHSHVVSVFGAGVVNEQPYLAMEYVEGSSLDRMIERCRTADKNNEDKKMEDRNISSASDPSFCLPSFSPSERYRFAAKIGSQVASALDYANRHDVLHRDVKPSNILMDEDGNALLSDFGLARLLDERDDLTLTGQVIGTLRYMAPEALRGEVDHRSDIYSLGATLYELVTLRPPYDETNRSRLLQRIANSDPMPARRADRRVPRDLESILGKSMFREPRRRYQSAGEMADDLQRWLDGKPIRARRVSLADRFALYARRNPQIATLAVSLAGVIVTSLIILTILWQQARYERNVAVEARGEADSARVETMRERIASELQFIEFQRQQATQMIEREEYARAMALTRESLDRLNRLEQDSADELPTAGGRGMTVREVLELRERVLSAWLPKTVLDGTIPEPGSFYKHADQSRLRLSKDASGRFTLVSPHCDRLAIWGSDVVNGGSFNGKPKASAADNPERERGASSSTHRLPTEASGTAAKCEVVSLPEASEQDQMRFVDSRLAVTLHGDGTLTLLDFASGERTPLESPAVLRESLIASRSERQVRGANHDYTLLRTWTDRKRTRVVCKFQASRAFSRPTPHNNKPQLEAPATEYFLFAWNLDSRNLLNREPVITRQDSSILMPDDRVIVETRSKNGVRDRDTFQPIGGQLALKTAVSADGRTVAFMRLNNVSVSAVGLDGMHSSSALPASFTTRSRPSSLSLAGDGSLLACGCEDGSIIAWNLSDGRQLPAIQGHSARIESVGLSHDGECLLTGDQHGNVSVWEPRSGKVLMAPVPCGNRILNTAWVDDGATRQFAVLTSGGRLRILRLPPRDGGTLIAQLPGRCTVVRSIDKASRVYVLAGTGTRLLSAASGEILGSVEGRRPVHVSPTGQPRAFLSPSGRRIAVAGQPGEIRDTVLNEVICTFPEPLLPSEFAGEDELVLSVESKLMSFHIPDGAMSEIAPDVGMRSDFSVSPDGRWIATVERMSPASVPVRVYFRSGRGLAWAKQPALETRDKSYIDGVTFCPRSRILVAFGSFGLCTWQLSGSRVEPHEQVPMPDGAEQLTFSQAGDLAAVLTSSHHVVVFETGGWQRLGKAIPVAGFPLATSFTRDNKAIVTVTKAGEIDVWDWYRGAHLLPSRKPTGELTSATIDAEQNAVFTGGKNGDVRRWPICLQP